MDSKFSTSFIPKQTLVKTGQIRRPSSSTSLFAIISIGIFLISGALAGGTYLYHEKLKTDLDRLDSEIEDRKASFELGRIEEVRIFSERVEAVEEMLSKHVALSQFFTLLENQTDPEVSFEKFSFRLDDQEGAVITLTGVATGFVAVARQSDSFLSRPELSEHSFSSFKLEDGGFVSFSYRGVIKREAIAYRTLISGPAAPTQ